jgi:hypothetical protein
VCISLREIPKMYFILFYKVPFLVVSFKKETMQINKKDYAEQGS